MRRISMKLCLAKRDAKKIIDSEDVLKQTAIYGIRKKMFSIEQLLKIAANEKKQLSCAVMLSLNISSLSPWYDLLIANTVVSATELLKAYLIVKKTHLRIRPHVGVVEVACLLCCSIQTVYMLESKKFPVRQGKRWLLRDIYQFAENSTDEES